MPAQGARATSLVDLRSGRELLLTRSRRQNVGDDHVQSDAGGWEEMFPNDDPWGSYRDQGVLRNTSFVALPLMPGKRCFALGSNVQP